MAYGSSSTVCWELSCTRRVSPRSLRKTRRSQRRDSVSELPASLRCLSLYLRVIRIAVALRRERAAPRRPQVGPGGGSAPESAPLRAQFRLSRARLSEGTGDVQVSRAIAGPGGGRSGGDGACPAGDSWQGGGRRHGPLPGPVQAGLRWLTAGACVWAGQLQTPGAGSTCRPSQVPFPPPGPHVAHEGWEGGNSVSWPLSTAPNAQN